MELRSLGMSDVKISPVIMGRCRNNESDTWGV
jgi:hypothetical protein